MNLHKPKYTVGASEEALVGINNDMFALTHDEYIKSLSLSNLSYLIQSKIQLTDDQQKMLDNYINAFKTPTSSSYRDVYFMKFNDIIRPYIHKGKCLSVGNFALINKLTKPDTKYDIILYEDSKYPFPSNEHANDIKYTTLDKVDYTVDGYDTVIVRYRYDLTFEYSKLVDEGHLLANTVFDRMIKTTKTGSDTLILIFDLMFMLPIHVKFFSAVSSQYKSFNIIRVWDNIFIIFTGFISSTSMPTSLNLLITNKTIDYNFYGKKVSYEVPYDIEGTETKQGKIIATAISAHLTAFYHNLNANFYSNRTFEELIYENIYLSVEVFKKQGQPYNKYYLAQTTGYFEKVYNELTGIMTPLRINVVKYKTPTIFIEIYKPVTEYKNEVGNKLLACEKYQYDWSIRELYQDFTKGVANYINSHSKDYGLTNKVSNAFIKLWEIYYEFDMIKNKINAFHMCEAPGQWIKTTEHFISRNVSNASNASSASSASILYDWHANSLNPWNKDNIKKFGNDIINDTYGLLKKHKNKWLFGKDETGDITVSENIKWYRECALLKDITLVTGDAGLPVMDLVMLQKLDFSQALITIATCGLGGGCVVKCFTPYLKSNPKTLESLGFFVCLIYIYYYYFHELYLYKPYASNSYSGEFYIVCKGFCGINDIELDKFLAILDKFEENLVFIRGIPDTFVTQLYAFLEKLVNYNISIIEKRNFLHTCVNDKNDILGFKKIMKEAMESQDERFKKWIDMFGFK